MVTTIEPTYDGIGDMVSTQEAADYLGITSRQIRRLIDEGKLQGAKLVTPMSPKGYHWRVLKDSIEAYRK